MRNVLGIRVIEIPLQGGGKVKNETQYLCAWDNYPDNPDSDATWEPEKHVNEQRTYITSRTGFAARFRRQSPLQLLVDLHLS